MNVKVVDLMSEVENGPFLDAVGLDLDNRGGRTVHRIWLYDDIRPGHFRDIEICFAVFHPLIFGERKDPSAYWCGRGWHVIDPLQRRPWRNRSLPARDNRKRRIDPDRHEVARRHQVCGATRLYLLGPQHNAMLCGRGVEPDIKLDSPARRHHDRVYAHFRLRSPELVGERHAIETHNLN